MSFAQGFAAGSAAVERGLKLRDLKQQREKEEAYQAELQGLADKYQMSQDAVTAYEQQRAGLEATGAPMASAVAQPQYSPEAQQIFGIGGPAPQMSMSPVSAPTAGLVAGDRAGVVMPEAPQAMSYADMQRRAAGIALGAGRTDEYLQLQGALDAREQANRQYDLAVKKFDALNDQFTKTFGEQVRSTKVSEGQAQDKIDVLIANQDRLAKETAATINNMTTRLNAFTDDRDTAQAVTSGKELFKQGLRQGKNVDEILAEIEAKYPGEENNAMRMAAVTSATDEYYTQNGINDVIAGKIVQRATSPITAALNTDFGGDIAKEATNWNEVLQSFADPDYSDGIETRLVQIKDPETGEPTGAFELAYGDRTLEQFNSIEDVRNYAKQYQEGFTKNPFQIGQYIENTKAKAAADIARAKSTSEKNELFAGFLEANPHLMGDEAKLMQLRMQLGISSPLDGWGSGSDYVNTGAPAASSRQAVMDLRQRKAGLKAAQISISDEAEFILGLEDPAEREVALRSASPEVRAAMEDISRNRLDYMQQRVGLRAVPVM